VENIVPDYLTLLHGVLDSPDIPLNVSRSYLQSDNNVKKISSHITKKVADKLLELYTNDKADFEKKWEDIKLFIQYGMLSDEKFYEKAIQFALLKNISGEYFTFEQYKEKVKENQTDKNKHIVMLYAQNANESYAYIERAKQKGYDVLLMEGELDVHAMSQLEQKSMENKDNGMVRFVRVDSDVIDRLIEKEDNKPESNLTDDQKEALRLAFEGQIDPAQRLTYTVTLESVAADELPVFITQNEFMRRMREMSKHQQGMSFYGNLPEQYNLVVNMSSEKIKSLLPAIELFEVPQEKTETKDAKDEKLAPQKDVKVTEEAQKSIRQLIDIALLAVGQLKGEELAKFVNRSVELL
ncbi:MAG: molecular chaperone HtpG, partial [Paludibacteraceae bacterium]|nr:molecular chaperone HtpG [Paludibacteraceae bacterium]